VPFNQKVELVATLYKDFKTNRYQEKMGKIILRELVKGQKFGNDGYKGVGRYSLALHSLMDQMGFERSLTKEQTIKLELVAGATLGVVITAMIMSSGSGSEDTQSVASYVTEGSDMSTMAASFAYLQPPSTRPVSGNNTTLSTVASLCEGNPNSGVPDEENDGGRKEDPRPALRSPFNYRSGRHAIPEAADDDWGELEGSSHKEDGGVNCAYEKRATSAQQDATPSGHSSSSTAASITAGSSASSRASTVPANATTRVPPQSPYHARNGGDAGHGDNPPGSDGPNADALVTVQLSSTGSDGGDGNDSCGGGDGSTKGSTKGSIQDSAQGSVQGSALRSRPGSAQGSARGKEERSHPHSFLSKILKPLRGAPGKEDSKLKVVTSRDSAQMTASPPLSPVLLGIDSLAAPDSTRSLSSSETSREAFALYDQELRRRAQHIAQLEQTLADQTRQCNAQLHSLRLELEHTAVALKKERVARAVIAEVTHRGDDLLAAALSEARDEAVSAQGQFEEASAELQAVEQELLQYQEQVTAMQRRQAEEMTMAQQAAAVAAEASVRRAEAEEEGQSLLDSLIAVKVSGEPLVYQPSTPACVRSYSLAPLPAAPQMEHANMSLELEQARRSNAQLQKRLLGYAQQVAGLEVLLARQAAAAAATATGQGPHGAGAETCDDHLSNVSS
jgi:hypothetical protein